MIATILRVFFTGLKRDRVALMMTFILPIAFFSIFAMVFGGQGGSTPTVDVAVVDQDGSDLSGRIVRALGAERGLAVSLREKGKDALLTTERATALVKAGQVDVAIVIPKGFSDSFPGFGASAPELEILADPSNPIAPQMVSGLLQKEAMTAAPDVLVDKGLAAFDKYAGGLTQQQRDSVTGWKADIKRRLTATATPIPTAGAAPKATSAAGSSATTSPDATPAQEVFSGLVRTRLVDVVRQNAPRKGIIAFYAAGIGVMFLLFSCAGAGGALLDEAEAGTLERVLSTGIGMTGLLVGKWLSLVILGITQLTVMFVYGMLVFKLELLNHLPGFFVMTVVTAAAAAGFGLVLATAARTRAQLGGMSTIVILIMSAVGGSMFPRFLMSETMKKLGLLTFNGWALDGYLKVFWRDAPLVDLWPQVLVLVLLAAAFLGIARLLARRWETV